MFNWTSVTLLAALIGGISALIVGLLADRLGAALGLLDYPDPHGGRKRHDHPTPLVGGLGMLIATTCAAISAFTLSRAVSPAVQFDLQWIGGVVLIMSLIGMLDDRFHLSPQARLAIALVTLGVAVVRNPELSVNFLLFSSIDQLIVLPAAAAVIFTLLCLIGLLNAVNMADGKNGIVISLALLWSLTLLVHATMPIRPLLAASAAALAVLLWFNMRGRLFLGDGGSYGVSAFFGLLAIYAYNHDFTTLRADQVAVLFAVPVFDALRVMSARVLRGRSPFDGDRDHLHHHLAFRWGWPGGLVVYLLVAGVPMLLTALWPRQGLGWLALAATLYIAALVHANRAGRPLMEGREA